MNFLMGIILVLLGISLMGTVLQNENAIWSNSQNMLFGCIGGIIAYFIGLPVDIILISVVVCIIISYIVFRFYLNTNIFTIKSNFVINLIIIFSLIIVLVPCFMMTFQDISSLILRDPIIIIFGVSILFGIPRFVKVIRSYNLDNVKNGEIIYIDKSFWDNENLSINKYNGKEFYVLDLNLIIGKKCEVLFDNVKFYIIINKKKYYIKEKDNNLLVIGNKIKISKENLKNRIIREDDIIIVEKI